MTKQPINTSIISAYEENRYTLNKDLILDVTSSGIEIALLEDDRLVELHQEKYDNQFGVGDIFVARIKKTVAGLNAAFVDIGFGKDAFLHYSDLSPQMLSVKKYAEQVISGKHNSHLLNNFEVEPEILKTGKISDVLTKRDLLLVQVLKESISTKGPRLSCEITLAGRFMVLNPFNNNVSVSRKIKQPEERLRLQRLAESIKPQNFGLIVRTAAENRKVAELHEDIESLLSKWQLLYQELRSANPPQKIMSEVNKASGILRDLLNPTFSRVVVNDKSVAAEVSSFVSEIEPGAEKIVSYYSGKTPVFDYYKVTKQIKSAFGKNVNLPSGAYLVVEHTEALHVIDVNSGHKMSSNSNQDSNALAVNLEAVTEIARQLRLRDLGGIIIIDFIDQKSSESKKILQRRMEEAMQADRARHTILPLSQFGIMQITRERVRPELQIATAEVCPTCRGTGRVKATILLIDEIENNLSYLLNELDYQQLKLSVHPFVEAYIKKGIISRQWKWFWKHKKWVSVILNTQYSLTEYSFFDSQNEEIKL